MNAANSISRIKAKGGSFFAGFASNQATREGIGEYAFKPKNFRTPKKKYTNIKADYNVNDNIGSTLRRPAT